MNPILSEKKASHVRPDSTWPALIQTAAREVFELMVATEIAPAVYPGSACGKVSAMVGFAGALGAIFRLRCTEETAASIARKMLGGQEPESRAHSCDALGEICNMVAGNFKGKISALSDGCMLSVPTVVAGDDYEVYSGRNGQVIEVSLEYDGQPLWLSLEIYN